MMNRRMNQTDSRVNDTIMFCWAMITAVVNWTLTVKNLSLSRCLYLPRLVSTAQLMSAVCNFLPHSSRVARRSQKYEEKTTSMHNASQEATRPLSVRQHKHQNCFNGTRGVSGARGFFRDRATLLWALPNAKIPNEQS